MANSNDTQAQANDELRTLQRAARSGHFVAQSNLGDWYFQRGNWNRAISWYSRAADQNVGPAEFQIGTIFFMDLGMLPHYPSAAAWFEKAAQHGDSRAQDKLMTGLEPPDGRPIVTLTRSGKVWRVDA
jgi:TPR repeat protein